MKRSRTDKGNKAVSGTPVKAVASTIAAVLCLFLLGLAGVELPRLYNEYTDKQILNRPEYTQNSVETYSYAYASMADVLEAIVRYQADGGVWGEVDIPLTEANEVSDDELLNYLDEELKKLYECDVLPCLWAVDEDNAWIENKELYMLYPSEGEKITGTMQFWSISGVVVKDKYSQYYLNALMDAQFHSLISLEVYSMYDSGYIPEYWEAWNLFEAEGWDPAVEGMYYLGDKLARGLGSYFGIPDVAQEEETSDEDLEGMSPIERRIMEKEEKAKAAEKAYQVQQGNQFAYGESGSENTDEAYTEAEVYRSVMRGDNLSMYGQLYFSEDTYVEVIGELNEGHFEFSLAFNL